MCKSKTFISFYRISNEERNIEIVFHQRTYKKCARNCNKEKVPSDGVIFPVQPGTPHRVFYDMNEDQSDLVLARIEPGGGMCVMKNGTL